MKHLNVMCRLWRGLSLSSLYNEAISKFYSAQSVSQLIHHLKNKILSLSVSRISNFLSDGALLYSLSDIVLL